MQIFVQLSKVDEEKRLVYGIAAQEIADHSGEIMDYAKSKPNFESWSETMQKDSNGASMGNLRAMHGQVAAGKLTDIGFDDVEKSIVVCAKVVDDNEWNKVLEGVYTGFSIGGKYGDKWQDGDLKRYVAIPNEISLVDRPCMPTARFFDIQKSDGAMTKMEFKNQPIENDIEVTGTPEDADALAKLLADSGLSIGDAITELQKSIDARAAEKSKKDVELKKSLSGISSISQLIQSLQYLISYGIDDNDGDDDKPFIDRLNAVSITLAEILRDYTNEETAEIIGESADGADDNMEMFAVAFDLIKAGARNSKADMMRIQEMHDHAAAMGADCSGKAEKSAQNDDLAKADLQKAITNAIAPLQKRIEELEALPEPVKGVLLAVGKGEEFQEMQKIVPVINPTTGNESEVATLIKASRGNMRTIY